MRVHASMRPKGVSLGRCYPVRVRRLLVPDRNELGEPGESKELAASALAPILRCPSCGQDMRLERIIRPTGHCPP